MNPSNRNSNSEDMFADTRMTFGEHLEDLRKHLWRAIYGFLIALAISFFPGWYVLDFISAPVEEELNRFYDKRAESVYQDLKAGQNSEVQETNKLKEGPVYITTQEFAHVWKIEPPEDRVENGMVRLDTLVPPVLWAHAMTKANRLIG